jgi:hypothetical protein
VPTRCASSASAGCGRRSRAIPNRRTERGSAKPGLPINREIPKRWERRRRSPVQTQSLHRGRLIAHGRAAWRSTSSTTEQSRRDVTIRRWEVGDAATFQPTSDKSRQLAFNRCDNYDYPRGLSPAGKGSLDDPVIGGFV